MPPRGLLAVTTFYLGLAETERLARNPTGGGGGAGSPPSHPPALHLRLRTDPPPAALPSNPRLARSPMVSLSRPSHSLSFSVCRLGRCSGGHLPSSGDLRPAQVSAAGPRPPRRVLVHWVQSQLNCCFSNLN